MPLAAGTRLGPYQILGLIGAGGMGEFYAARAVVPLDGGPTRPVPDSDVNELPVQWSDDSQRLFVFRPGEIPSRVFRLEVGSGRRTLWAEISPPDPNATGIGGFCLTRDGRTGVYAYAHAQAELYLVNGLR